MHLPSFPGECSNVYGKNQTLHYHGNRLSYAKNINNTKYFGGVGILVVLLNKALQKKNPLNWPFQIYQMEVYVDVCLGTLMKRVQDTEGSIQDREYLPVRDI